eukprot:tig00000411_g544.t1
MPRVELPPRTFVRYWTAESGWRSGRVARTGINGAMSIVDIAEESEVLVPEEDVEAVLPSRFGDRVIALRGFRAGQTGTVKCKSGDTGLVTVKFDKSQSELVWLKDLGCFEEGNEPLAIACDQGRKKKRKARDEEAATSEPRRPTRTAPDGSSSTGRHSDPGPRTGAAQVGSWFGSSSRHSLEQETEFWASRRPAPRNAIERDSAAPAGRASAPADTGSPHAVGGPAADPSGPEAPAQSSSSSSHSGGGGGASSGGGGSSSSSSSSGIGSGALPAVAAGPAPASALGEGALGAAAAEARRAAAAAASAADRVANEAAAAVERAERRAAEAEKQSAEAKRRAEQAEGWVEQAMAEARQAEARAQQAEGWAEQAVAEAQQAEARAARAEGWVEQAMAEARQADARAGQAEGWAEQAVAEARQAEARAAAQEARAAALGARLADSAPVGPAALAGLSAAELQRAQERLAAGAVAVASALAEARAAEATRDLQDTRCVICMDRRRSVLIVPCKHITLCDPCFDDHVAVHVARRPGGGAAPPAPPCPTCRVAMDVERCFKGAYLCS